MLQNFPTLNEVKDAMPIIEQLVALIYKSTTMPKTVNKAQREPGTSDHVYSIKY